MKSLFLIVLFFCMCIGLLALSSYTDTALFTLDVVEPVVNIVAPNGGEEWYIGDTNNILWNATDTNMPGTPVNIWYSLNGGTLYTLLAENNANSGTLPWEMPSTQSYNARVRIRVTDAFGNFTQKTSASAFSITYVPPKAPEGVGVDISSAIDAIVSWQPVTQTIYDTPITPDGYIVLYNETPYVEDQFYYFLGRSYTTDYTHHDVAEFRADMFYKVVAYKNYSREMEDILNKLCNGADKERILWKDALKILSTGGEK